MAMCARPSSSAMMPSMVRFGMTVISCPDFASIVASYGSMTPPVERGRALHDQRIGLGLRQPTAARNVSACRQHQTAGPPQSRTIGDAIIVSAPCSLAAPAPGPVHNLLRSTAK